jgi:hypothetical protein
MFINSVKQTDASCSPETLSSQIADTDNRRLARNAATTNSYNATSGGFTLRSLQLLDYAVPDLEAQAPVIISVTPQVLLASHSSVTVTGSPFAAGAACSALFLDGSVSTSCIAMSPVEIVVKFSINALSGRPSILVAVIHNGLTLRVPTSRLSPPPITAGLIAHYNADSWTGSQWFDLSGAGNHVTEVGGSSIAVARPVGAPAYIYGASTAWMRFPVGILPSAEYTLFYVARYNGPTRGRIFQGIDTDWLSGFYSSMTLAYRHDCRDIAPLMDLHGSDWVLGSDRSDSYRSNGVDRSTNTANGCQAFDRLAINTGLTSAETSDFAIQSVLVYNVKLSDADVQRVEAWLQAQQPAFTPANLQVGAGLNCISFVLFSLYI